MQELGRGREGQRGGRGGRATPDCIHAGSDRHMAPTAAGTRQVAGSCPPAHLCAAHALIQPAHVGRHGLAHRRGADSGTPGCSRSYGHQPAGQANPAALPTVTSGFCVCCTATYYWYRQTVPADAGRQLNSGGPAGAGSGTEAAGAAAGCMWRQQQRQQAAPGLLGGLSLGAARLHRRCVARQGRGGPREAGSSNTQGGTGRRSWRGNQTAVPRLQFSCQPPTNRHRRLQRLPAHPHNARRRRGVLRSGQAPLRRGQAKQQAAC